MSDILRLSPLDRQHRELGARLVQFAGWDMPVMYDSIIAEHLAVRKECGIFDISHMGQIFAEGNSAGGWLDGLLTNNVETLEVGKAHYTFLLNDEGGVIDDLILYRVGDKRFLLLVNAARIQKDWDWLQEHLVKGVNLTNESDEWAGMAIQGPKSPEIYSEVMEGRTLPSRNSVDDLTHQGSRLLVCRTGYTGEDGFELFCPAGDAGRWWKAFVEAGAKPCGLGARDTLRLEMCYPLNGQDLSPCRTPLEAGLGMFVDLEKGEFSGAEVLRAQKEDGCRERLMALKMIGRSAPPRPGYSVLDSEGKAISALTSGGLSPSLSEGIALAYLPTDRIKIGSEVFVEMRGQKIPAVVTKKPFFRK